MPVDEFVPDTGGAVVEPIAHFGELLYEFATAGDFHRLPAVEPMQLHRLAELAEAHVPPDPLLKEMLGRGELPRHLLGGVRVAVQLGDVLADPLPALDLLEKAGDPLQRARDGDQ